MTPLRGRVASARASLHGATGATAAANLVILAGAALGGIVSARALGPAGRGQLALATLWPTLIQIVGGIGLQSSCSYHVALWPDRRAALLSWLRFVIPVQVIAMTAASAATLWALCLELRLDRLLAAEYSTWAAGATISLYGVCCAQGSRDFARFNVLRLIAGALPGMLMLAGAATLRLTPAEAGAAYLLPVWWSALLAGKWLNRLGRPPVPEPLSRQERRSVWSYGWRSVASLSGSILNSSADQLTLGLLVPVSSLGIYSGAASASSPLASLVGSVGMVRLPTVAALTGEAKTAAAWRAIRQATWSLALVAPVLAVALPWAVPYVYGARYAAAVVPAEILLLGTALSALAGVADDMLRAHGRPGFVSVTQGAGGVITAVGTFLFARHLLTAVSAASSLGFAFAFALALVRLRAATRRPPGHAVAARGRGLASSRGAAVLDRFHDDVPANPYQHVGRDIEVDNAARSLTDPDPPNRSAHDRPGAKTGGFPVTKTAQPPSWRVTVTRQGLPDEPDAAHDGSAPLP
jgi:O-antigen/teichoic acid export membrane protein